MASLRKSTTAQFSMLPTKTQKQQTDGQKKNKVSGSESGATEVYPTTGLRESHGLFSYPLRRVEKQITPQKNFNREQMQQFTASHEGSTGRREPDRTKRQPKYWNWECLGCSWIFKQKRQRLHSGMSTRKLETTKTTKAPLTPEDCGSHLRTQPWKA